MAGLRGRNRSDSNNNCSATFSAGHASALIFFLAWPGWGEGEGEGVRLLIGLNNFFARLAKLFREPRKPLGGGELGSMLFCCGGQVQRLSRPSYLTASKHAISMPYSACWRRVVVPEPSHYRFINKPFGMSSRNLELLHECCTVSKFQYTSRCESRLQFPKQAIYLLSS